MIIKEKKLKDPKRSSLNLLLLSIALIIFGALSLVFTTQMELVAEWSWEEIYGDYHADLQSEMGMTLQETV